MIPARAHRPYSHTARRRYSSMTTGNPCFRKRHCVRSGESCSAVPRNQSCQCLRVENAAHSFLYNELCPRPHNHQYKEPVPQMEKSSDIYKAESCFVMA